MNHRNYFDLLPPHIQKQFLDNMKKQGKDSAEYLSRSDYEWNFLDFSLDWAETKEGHTYWSELDSLFRTYSDTETISFEQLYTDFPEHSKRDEVINNYPIY